MGFNSAFKGLRMLTYSMEQILPEKLTGPQLVKKFPAFDSNPKVRYRIYKRPPTFPILRHSYPFHASPFHSLKIHFSFILASMPNSSKSLSLHQVFPQKSCAHFFCPTPLLHACPSHSSRFDRPNYIL